MLSNPRGINVIKNDLRQRKLKCVIQSGSHNSYNFSQEVSQINFSKVFNIFTLDGDDENVDHQSAGCIVTAFFI